jgi:hypothetical protein
MRLWVPVALVAGAMAALPMNVSAQTAPKRAPQLGPEYNPDELTPGQIRRAQEREQLDQRNRANVRDTAPPERTTVTSSRPEPTAIVAPPASAPAVSRSNIDCKGVWSKDASHIKLANMFKLDNVIYTDVEGPGATKVMASVLYPKDPKRRLEVWWKNEQSRSGLYLLVINGQSTWTVPKGLHLGMGLATVEKLNGKPFKFQGFGKDGGNTTDWDNGQLGALPGGCKVALKFAPDPKAPQAARDAVAIDREFDSTDVSMRAARPTIAEIILGY